MLSSRQSSAPDHGSRSGSRHSTIGNSWQDGEDMCALSGGKKTAGANARPRQALLSSLQPVFPCGLMQGKHEMLPVSPPEFTTLTHNDSLLERFLRWPRVCCSRLGATAHLSGQKLLTFQGIYHLLQMFVAGGRYALWLCACEQRRSPPCPPPIGVAEGRVDNDRHGCRPRRCDGVAPAPHAVSEHRVRW